MAKIETALDMGARPIPQAGIRVVSQDTGAVGQGMQAMGQGMGRAAVVLEQRQKEDALSEAQRAAAELNDYTTDLLFNPEKGYLNQKGENAIAQGEIVGQAAMERLALIRGRIKNPIALQAFDTASRSTIAQANEIAMKHHAAERASYNASVNKAYVESNMNTAVVAWNGELPSILPNLNAGIDAIRAQGVADGEPLESISNKIALFESKTLGAAIKRQAITDPMAAQRQLEKYGDRLVAEDRVALESAMQPLIENEMAAEIVQRAQGGGAVPVGADANIRAVLRREGGYVSNDGGAGPTNLGVNSTANPDIDVRNLTEEQAVALYKERYWAPIGADNLPPQVAAIAFDAAVNQGVGYAKEMLAETGGDPAKMLAHREARYRNTAKMPGKEQYLNGWLNRLNEFRGSTGGASPAGAVTNEQLLQMSNGNPRIAAQARKLINENIRAENEARKLAIQEATDAADRFLMENNGDERLLQTTPEGRAIMMQLHEVAPSVGAKYVGQDVETDPRVLNDIYSRQAQGDFSMNPLDHPDSLSRSDMTMLLKRQADLQADPKQAAQALSVEGAIKNVQPIILGNTKANTPSGAQRLEQFRWAVMQQVRLLEEAENDGKMATPVQVQRAVYAAMRPVTTTEGLDRDMMAFEVPLGTDPSTVMPYGIGKDIVNSTFVMQEDVNMEYHANQWLDMAGQGVKAWLPENFAPVADKVTLFFKDANSNAVRPVSFGDLVAKAEKDLIERGIMPDQASVATYISRAFSKGFVTVRGQQ